MVMKDNEEELQNRIERGGSAHGMDARAYRHVFQALGKELDYELPADFAAKVANRILVRDEKRLSSEYIWFAAGILCLAAAFIWTIVFIGFQLDFGFLNGMAAYKGLAIFGIVFIIGLNWLDRKLLREGRFQQKF
jgi:hypothetical protein